MSGSAGAYLYDSTVAHVRRIDPPASFAHRMYLWLVDLDVPQALPGWLRPFARFDGRDHFDPEQPGGIRAKLDAWLATRGVDLQGGRVLMLASARVLGHVFNPITVFWCHRPDGALECVVAEVHNTYRGRHAYLLRPDAEDRASADKEFYVSPFQSIDGHYRMHLPEPDSRLIATVVLRTGAGDTALAAIVRGVRRPATIRWLVRMLLARPFVPHRVAALIRWHAIGLWARGAPRPQSISRAGELHG
ncbi:hypothetical protein SAMN05216266_109253 [Amycolatopsis marina]|uniref:DUF1365 domain-containing protein n=1 Tax=Amycolatopsis marina TaxID=490629 RepID=A0A1I1APY9_9PSEU|nr:DUF1365 domain-containing protein [Amycolatopsis marina]SFB38413.1 hypothetical protein SAMN05216266_109253 [Amycolatopsis marina]